MSACVCVCAKRNFLLSSFSPIHLVHIILVIKRNDFVSRKNIPQSKIEQKVGNEKLMKRALISRIICTLAHRQMFSFNDFQTFRLPVNETPDGNGLCKSILFELFQIVKRYKVYCTSRMANDPFDGS